jgi:hypothetical protein
MCEFFGCDYCVYKHVMSCYTLVFSNNILECGPQNTHTHTYIYIYMYVCLYKREICLHFVALKQFVFLNQLCNIIL